MSCERRLSPLPPGLREVVGPVGEPHQILAALSAEFTPTVLPTKLFGLVGLLRLPAALLPVPLPRY